MDKILKIKRQLENALTEIAQCTKKQFGGGIEVTQPSANDFYFGLWPDDWYFPAVTVPQLLSDEDAEKLFEFLTENIEDLPVFPDRIEPDGHCVFQPGLENSPHGKLMPVHLPAAWFRVIGYLWQKTGNGALKERWRGVSERSVAQLVFKDGLPFVSDSEPQVAFAFFDTVGLAGNDLMCCVVLEKGLREAAKLFGGEFGEECAAKAKSIADNIGRLKSDEGYFITDTLGCRQFSPWSNGLLYGTDYISQSDKKGIRNYMWAHRDELVKFGMVKHVLGDWKRMNPVWNGERGTYMDGGYWAVGTAYSLKMLYDCDADYAVGVLDEMLDTLRTYDYPEWIGANGKSFGARKFLMSIALPLAAVNSIVEKSQLINRF